jgi:hypothetical protein
MEVRALGVNGRLVDLHGERSPCRIPRYLESRLASVQIDLASLVIGDP